MDNIHRVYLLLLQLPLLLSKSCLSGVLREAYENKSSLKRTDYYSHNMLLNGLLGPKFEEMPASPFIARSHLLEIQRFEAIDWAKYEPFFLRSGRNREKRTKFYYTNKSCFETCVPLTTSIANMSATVDNSRISNGTDSHLKHQRPGSLSLVMAWCCESIDWILEKVNFRGHLTQVWIYDKCSRTGILAKDGFHLKEGFKAKRYDLECRALTPEGVREKLRIHNHATANDVEVRVVDANEPGRSSCMSTDECGAYLRHIADQYNSLTDGIYFIQSDNSHKVTNSIEHIVKATSILRAAPPVFFSLTDKGSPGGNPMGCIDRWSALGMFKGTQKGNFASRSVSTLTSAYHLSCSSISYFVSLIIYPMFCFVFFHKFSNQGANRNGVFYVSRIVIRRRPREFWQQLKEGIIYDEMCLSFNAKRACKFEPFRPRRNNTAETTLAAAASIREPINDDIPGLPAEELNKVLTLARYLEPPISRENCAKELRRGRNLKCTKACNALEHIWPQIFCEPCHTMSRAKDPRNIWG